MKSWRFKKGFSLLTAILMVFTMIPATIFVSAADYPVMEVYTAASSADYHKYYNQVVTVTFLDSIDTVAMNASDTIGYWDVSADKDGSVMAWMKLNSAETEAAGADRYDVYIAGEGGVGANPSSTHIFYLFSALKAVNGIEHFKTENVTDMSFMFGGCNSLEKLDLSTFDTSSVTKMASLFRDCKSLAELNVQSFDTSKVTTMAYMFSNCHALTELDLGSFDTRLVTNMDHMFYLCQNLKKLYTGENWSVDAVTNSNAMFNCCYVIEGKISYNYNAVNDKSMATTEYYLTDVSEKPQPEKTKYTVTYEFVGDTVPEGVTVTEAKEYEEGTTVQVESDPSAEGYEFSGWSSEDADITAGSFTINNNVKIVGSWTKLYKVEYKYDENYELPDGAPEIPDTELWFAPGEDVATYGVPYVPEYVFVGWTTDDAEIIGDEFTMPEKDVTIYGYFKKPVESVEILGGEITLDKDDTDGEKINVYVKPEDATIKDIIYESSDETVVKVDKNGVITPVGEGTATVTVSSKDDPTKSDTVTVTVKTFVKDIEVDKTQITLNKDDTDKITTTVIPDDATNSEVEFESGDESIVTVDENGSITAVGEGTTTITVSSKDDPDIKKEVTVTVKIPVTEITATEDFTLNVGEEKNVDASVNEDATNKELTYTSSNPEIAKVDNDGNVVAVGEGTTTIAITSKDDPTKTEDVVVTVKVPVTDITAEKTEITLDEGETEKINVTVTPDGATNKEVEFESGDESIVTVDENGNVTAVGEGTTTITVTSKDDPTKKDIITITVNKPEPPKVPVTDVTADKEKITLDIGETDKITVTVTPDDATNSEVEFESGDESIVIVDENGNITAVGEGTTTITVTSKDDPTKKDVITITVNKVIIDEPQYSIEAPDTVIITVGEIRNLNVNVNPEEGAPKVTYISGNEELVKVDADGNLTGMAEGRTTVTVELADGTVKVINVVIAAPVIPVMHHVCFGKTDGIGWYEVSVNGGDFKAQGPNSTLEVPDGAILVVRVQDMWIDDDFSFYVNGEKVEKDAANCITVQVDGYMLIGALSMDVEVPDVDESLNWFEKILKAIKDFFKWLFRM